MANHPEKEFQAGRGAKVVVWKNDKGYAITIQLPQYKQDGGEWKTASAFWRTDLPGLQRAIQRALEYCESKENP